MTSVVVVGDEASGAAAGGARSASWPVGTTCPLCLERDVSDQPQAIFYFQLAREVAKGARWMHVRCRCCDDCRLRVESLSRQRKIAAPFVAFAVVAAGLSFFADGPFVKAGISFPTSIAVGLGIATVVGGIPLYVLDRANRAVRKRLETSWLFRTVKGRFTAADGFMREDQWRVLPELDEKAKAEAISAEDVAKT